MGTIAKAKMTAPPRMTLTHAAILELAMENKRPLTEIEAAEMLQENRRSLRKAAVKMEGMGLVTRQQGENMEIHLTSEGLKLAKILKGII